METIKTYITFPKHETTVYNIQSLLTKGSTAKQIAETETVYWHLDDDSKNKAKYGTLTTIARSNLINQDYSNVPLDYHTFQIKKKSGGFREISAPNEQLKAVQKSYKESLEFCAVPHKAACAYVKEMSTYKAIAKHQANNSNAFLKLDIHDFFGSCTYEFVLKQLYQIAPFSFFDENEKENFERTIKICFKDGVLPQGAATSPTISNLIMVPFDYAISKMLSKINNKFCYTRYADDLLISLPEDFNFRDIVNKIKYIFRDTPLTLNEKKTRYGSRAGANWNLGLMLNQSNNITIGHYKKDQYKAMCFQMVSKCIKHTATPDEIQHFLGVTAYYNSIEPTHVDKVLRKYLNKAHLTIPPKAFIKILQNGNFVNYSYLIHDPYEY